MCCVSADWGVQLVVSELQRAPERYNTTISLSYFSPKLNHTKKYGLLLKTVLLHTVTFRIVRCPTIVWRVVCSDGGGGCVMSTG
jgi:hypothetical protein